MSARVVKGPELPNVNGDAIKLPEDIVPAFEDESRALRGVRSCIWKLRHDGWGIYFTQDAGPNLKLLFLEQDKEKIKEEFPEVEVIRLFADK